MHSLIINHRPLTIKNVAEYLQISVSTINKLLAEKAFPEADYRISENKKRLWAVSTIENYLESRKTNKSKGTK